MVADGQRRCEVCGRPISTASSRPHTVFCSERCRMVDLGRWLDGHYVIPGHTTESDAFGSAPLEEDPSGGDGGETLH